MISTPPPLQLEGSRILIVDDDAVNRVVLAGFLAVEEYTVAEATSGEEALAVYRAFKPDLVLLDVTLPKMDGFQTCRELQRRHGAALAPVLFITSRGSAQDIITGFSVGGVDYLTKPVGEKETLVRIRVHLSNRRLIEQLAQSNRRKNELLGMAAHDLRNPLASISGVAELLHEGAFGALTPEQAEVLKSVREESQAMLKMVNELLDVAAIESGVLQIKIERCDLVELIEHSIYLNQANAARKKTSIVFQRPATATWSRLDPGKIRQVIDNLVSNAVKYSPLGSTITVRLLAEKQHHVISVIDQGPGIPEIERHRLFKEFSTLSVPSTAGEKSTGLGLAICRRIVEAHHGTISAHNLAQGGCEFSAVFPIVLEEELPQTSELEQAQESTTA